MIFLVDKNDHNCIKGQVELLKHPLIIIGKKSSMLVSA